ncbi:MAG: PAS domain S-box protein, partial [Deltaproteobacteria bacterium]|nr:PAS domain S-box protein [Deltaproteobacteria bacterium]
PFHVDPEYPSPHLSVVVPLFSGKDRRTAVGALVLVCEAAQFLYPLIQSWPTPSDTAETLLVQKDGDDVLFLNELRHQKDTALKLRIPVSRADLPAAMAAGGREGIVEGKDYRGVEVVAAILRVPDSPWFMVAKVDSTEAFAEWRFRSIMILVFMLSVIGLVVAFGLVIRQRNLKAHYRELYRSETALSQAMERHSITLQAIGDAVMATDSKGRVDLMNPVAETLTGWKQEEARDRSINEVFRIINEGTRSIVEDPVARVLREGIVVGLANHTLLIARDGREIPIADSGAPIRDNNNEIIGVVLVFRDQTAERTHQKEIIESERKYRLLSDNTLDVIWTMNLDLEFTYVNPAIFSLMGFTQEEWIGSRLPEHCDEENFARMTWIIANETANGARSTGVIFEAVMFRKNGQPLPVEIHGKVIYDDGGQPVGLQGVTRDISERKQAEEALQYQDRLLREMGGIAKIGGWEFHPATGKGTWTEEVARIHDLDPSDETSLKRSLNFYLEESRAKIEKAVQDAIELGKPYDLELELITAKGARKWVRTIGQPKTENGKVVQVRGSFQDITEHKLAELRIEHLNRVLRSIRDMNQLIVRERDPGTLILDGCRLLVHNRGYASALVILTDEDDRPSSWAGAGMDDISESLNAFLASGGLPSCCDPGRTDREAVLIEDKADVCDKCPIAQNCTKMHTMCVRLIHGDVAYGYLIAALSHDLTIDDDERGLFTELGGDLAYALSFLRMDKARKESERKRESLGKQLLQAQKMESIGRLAGGVAHDYNNMLSVILGYSELALDKAAPGSPLRNDLREIIKATNRSMDITRQLLAFARRQTIAPKVLDLNDTLESMLKMLRRLIGEEIDLAWLPDADLWPVKIDPTQVDQILANLCVNARDAIGGVGKVTIETENVSFDEAYCADHAGFVPGNYVLIGVSDDGCGMDPETLDKVFEPFFTTKSTGLGTGLGLATVYGIVRQNNGFINIYSEPEKGTTVKIYLPRHTGAAVQALSESVTEIPSSRGETVLLVEDEVSILEIGKRMLEGLGYAVLTAGAPGEAMHLAEEHAGEINLLITDVVMPELNGRELANELRSFYPDLKILFMSGYTANVIAHRGVLEEGVCFMPKPFSRKDLALKVREALDTAKT